MGPARDSAHAALNASQVTKQSSNPNPNPNPNPKLPKYHHNPKSDPKSPPPLPPPKPKSTLITL